MIRYLLISLLVLSACHKPAATSTLASYSPDSPGSIQMLSVESDKAGRMVLRLNAQQILVKHRIPPTYPRQEALSPGTKIRCRATVTIDPSGRPYEVEVTDCLQPFQAESQRALKQWRWEPVLWRGEPVRARTDVYVSFRRRGA